MKLAITVLSNRDHKPAFTRSFSALERYIFTNGEKLGIERYIPAGIAGDISCLPVGREDAISYAKASGATHQLCIDDDMEFLPESLGSLISRKVNVVGANYVAKKKTIKWTARKDKFTELSSDGKTGIEEIYCMGFGFLLIDLSIFDTVKAPRFEIRWDEAINGYHSEDTYFFEKLNAHGIKSYVDHDAKVGHIGDFTYTSSVYNK